MKNTLISAAFLTASLVPGLSAAAVINVDFGVHAYTGTAAASDPGTYWNTNFTVGSPSATNLLESDGSTVSSVGVSVAGFTGMFSQDATWNNLNRDRFYLDNGGTSTISGLDANEIIDLYVYTSYWPGSYTVGAETLVASNETQGGSVAPFVEGLHYLHFENVAADAGGNVLLTINDTGASNSLGGLQIVRGTSSAVPNPGAATLLALGLAGLIRIRSNKG